MKRKTFKLLLIHEEFKDVIQRYIDQSDELDGEIVGVGYGREYLQGAGSVSTFLSLRNSTKFGGSAEIRLNEENTLIQDALDLWSTDLSFVVNGFERVEIKGRQDETSPFGLFWLIEIRTK